MDETFIAVSPVTKDLLEIVKKASANSSPILLMGELGCGKKAFARIIHKNCKNSSLPFFYYNCKSEVLLNLEKVSLENGCIFFEEIECLSSELQRELLKLIKNKADVKIVASTVKSLSDFVQKGVFLEELFFRLNVFPVRIPSLKVRKEDIIPLAEHFLNVFSKRYSKIITGFSEGSVKLLSDYTWPGNILELKDVISRSVLLCHFNEITTEDLHISCDVSADDMETFAVSSKKDKSLKSAINGFKRQYLLKILDECGWNQTKAGKVLKIQRTYVSRLMNELKIRDKN